MRVVVPGISRSTKEELSSGHASGRWNRRSASSSNPLSVPQSAQVQPQRSRSQWLLKYAQQCSQRGTRSPPTPVVGDWPRSSAAAKGVTATPHWTAQDSSASGVAGNRETVARTAMAEAGDPGLRFRLVARRGRAERRTRRRAQLVASRGRKSLTHWGRTWRWVSAFLRWSKIDLHSQSDACSGFKLRH